MTDEELIKDLDSFQEDFNAYVDLFLFLLSKLSVEFENKHNYALITDSNINLLKDSLYFNDDNKKYSLDKILSLKNKGK